jgi:hypothetical protein
MKPDLAIVDRGRGPQLSTSRITVQDLVPYFLRQCSYEQIREVMPILSLEEIQLVERYIRDHYDEVMEEDRRIRERNAGRTTPPELEEVLRRGGEKMAAFREEFRKRRPAERNGDPRLADVNIQGHVAFRRIRRIRRIRRTALARKGIRGGWGATNAINPPPGGPPLRRTRSIPTCAQ